MMIGLKYLKNIQNVKMKNITVLLVYFIKQLALE